MANDETGDALFHAQGFPKSAYQRKKNFRKFANPNNHSSNSSNPGGSLVG
jgi:uncharacterized protein (DUF2384 family)